MSLLSSTHANLGSEYDTALAAGPKTFRRKISSVSGTPVVYHEAAAWGF
jgi:hypothetical protein